MLLSVVVPVFNEQLIVEANLIHIANTIQQLTGAGVQLIPVDDGSRDQTPVMLRALATRDARIQPVYFTRNFGKEAAILAGLCAAKGDAAIVMDVDLQHPPELVGEMFRHWQGGMKVVEAVKRSRGQESLSSGLFSKLFYRVFRHIAGIDLNGQSDFKLLDREVVRAYVSLPERQRFFRALVPWLGYTSVRVPFDVQQRSGGETRWGTLKLFRYAIGNITAFSSAPLLWCSWIGGITLLAGGIIGSISLYQKLAGEALSGFTTVILLLALLGGAILVSIGIVGHYLARIYDELKNRPHYVAYRQERDDE